MLIAVLAVSLLLPSGTPGKPAFDAARLDRQLMGTPDEKREAADFVLAHTATTSSVYMFMASAILLNRGQVEDAGFLFYAAQLRSRFDLKRFPAVGQGGDSPGVLRAALNQQIGAAINPALMSAPKSLKAVVDRLRDWDVDTPSGYDPGWKYASATPPVEARALGQTMKQEYLQMAEGVSTLLNTPEYFKHYKTLLDYNQGPFEEMQKPEHVARKREAEKRLQEIEERMGIRGPFSGGPHTPPNVASAGAPAAPAAVEGGRLGAADVPRRVSGANEPRRLQAVDPVLPASLPADVPTTVILELTVGRQGKVTDVRILLGHAAVDRAVIAAARQWIYEPTLDNGVPVAVVIATAVKVR